MMRIQNLFSSPLSALKFFINMRRASISPDFHTFAQRPLLREEFFTWNAVLLGFAVHGNGRACLDYLSRMMEEGVHPDGISLLGVLVGCSHAGLICEARENFRDMEANYGVRRELKHCGCMADLFSRTGLIQEALEMLGHFPIKGDIYTWGALLPGCTKQGMVDVAEKAARHVQLLNPEDVG